MYNLSNWKINTDRAQMSIHKIFNVVNIAEKVSAFI